MQNIIELIIIGIGLIIFIISAVINCYEDYYPISDKSLSRNHCGIVTFNGSGGDIHFDDMTQDELLERLQSDYKLFSCFNRPCVNAKDPTHLAEYRIFTNRKGNVKTIGYITKDKVVFEGKEYYFN